MIENDPIDILILDFKKEHESLILLKSLKDYCLFPHRVIFLDNGSGESYSQEFKDEGLVDILLVNKENLGLGVGTKQLFEAAESKWSIYCQNDQFLDRRFDNGELIHLVKLISHHYLVQGGLIKSVSLAGDTCQGKYSERSHLIETEFYKSLEPLSEGGAGPKSHLIWREEQVQNIYKSNNFQHYIYPHPMFRDNGKRAIRQNPDGSLWQHNPDDKKLRLLRGPIKEKYVYPKFSQNEWDYVLKNQSWPDGQIPENEVKDSFIVPQWH